MRRFLLAAMLCVAVGRGARAEQDITAPHWDLATLMTGMRQVRGGTVRFVERKYLAVMTQPLQSSGILRYQAPDRLEKQTMLPVPATLAIAGDQLVVQRQGEATRTVSLRDYPELSGLIEGLRATLSGDLATLQRIYTLSLSGNQTDWRLALVPLDARTRKLVAAIDITGHWTSLSGVVTQEADGDRTEMVIDDTAP